MLINVLKISQPQLNLHLNLQQHISLDLIDLI